MNGIVLNVNNGGMIAMYQKRTDGTTFVDKYDPDVNTWNTETTITAGDMVMLLNLYRYIKKNDIQNDFINPTGKNKE